MLTLWTDQGCAPCRLEQDIAPADDEQNEKRRRRMSFGGVAPPPPEFFCPISHCLMTEPVTLLNTGITFNRTSMQAWMRTGAASLPRSFFLMAFPSHTAPMRILHILCGANSSVMAC